MTIYIYIDESGDLGDGKGSSAYFVIAALKVIDFVPLDRIIKKARRYKFRKELCKANEIKANKSSPEIREYLLKELSKIRESEAFFMTILKREMPDAYSLKDKHLFYNLIAERLAEKIDIKASNLEIRIDRSKGKQYLQKDLDSHFKRGLIKNSLVGKVEIFHSYSHIWAGLQFADLLAWSQFQNVEYHNFSYMDALKIPWKVFWIKKQQHH